MAKFTCVKPGVKMIERQPVPIRHIDDMVRVDVIGDTVIVTLVELTPSDESDGEPEAIVVDKIAFRTTIASDLVQFFWSALAQAGVKVTGKKPLMMQ